MCGIAGALSRSRAEDAWPSDLRAMADSLASRGPDDEGLWFEARDGVGLAHRRLSILDLSPEGHQPMVSASGRFVVSYNGETYNYPRLREALDAGGAPPAWRGHSDTEVMLAAIEERGILPAVRAFEGIFAFALWDTSEKVLYLARDALGVKPLYVGLWPDRLLFGSELRALEAHPLFQGSVDRKALAMVLRHGYVPAPRAIYREVRKVLPGTVMSIPWSPGTETPAPVTSVFWDVNEVWRKGQERPFDGSFQEAETALEELLLTTVEEQMISDVPLGAFLSGGIDSSAVTALMQVRASRPVKTFSIGFVEDELDESGHARAVARHLGTDHTEMKVTEADALEVLPLLGRLADEPFADASLIPTYLLSRLTRSHVTVSLSGDGGDELFCGYGRYGEIDRYWRSTGWLPPSLRLRAGQVLDRLFPDRYGSTEDSRGWGLGLGLWGGPRGRQIEIVAQKAAAALKQPDGMALYRHLFGHWRRPEALVPGLPEVAGASERPPPPFGTRDLAPAMMLEDLNRYLPGDILTKVDRASMAVGLEARVPLLDRRVVEFAAHLPLEMKTQGGTTKRVLRALLHRHIPPRLVERPKMGFGVPLGRWLRGDLRPWAEDLLGEERLLREGYLDPAPIRRKWVEHQRGERDWSQHLWNVLMFQSWLADRQH